MSLFLLLLPLLLLLVLLLEVGWRRQVRHGQTRLRFPRQMQLGFQAFPTFLWAETAATGHHGLGPLRASLCEVSGRQRRDPLLIDGRPSAAWLGLCLWIWACSGAQVPVCSQSVARVRWRARCVSSTLQFRSFVRSFESMYASARRWQFGRWKSSYCGSYKEDGGAHTNTHTHTHPGRIRQGRSIQSAPAFQVPRLPAAHLAASFIPRERPAGCQVIKVGRLGR